VGDISDYPGTSYIVTGGIVRGETFSFRLRARNLWGWGARSAEAEIVASRAPAQAAAPTTSVDAGTGDLVLTWSAPDDHGSEVTAYLVEIRDSLGSAWNEHAACDGSNAAVVAAR
jgi:large repetitive protein